MTRKRFIKRVMSYGYQRNEAQNMADCVSLYSSYAVMYKACSLQLSLHWTAVKLNSAITSAGNAISEWAWKFHEQVTTAFSVPVDILPPQANLSLPE